MSARTCGLATRGGVFVRALPRRLAVLSTGRSGATDRAQPDVRPWLLVAGLLLAGGLLQGCRPPADVPASPTPTTLVIGVAQPRSAASPDAAQAQIARILGAAGLVTVARNGRAQPALAARWEQSPDGRTWRFFLRPGLTFHDGSPVTAAAVRAAIDPTTFSPGPLGLTPGLRDVERVEAPSDLEVVVSLARPSSLLLEALALIQITKEDAGVGAGPYRLTSDEQGPVTLSAFDGFYRGRPAVDFIEIRGYPAARAAWTAMMRGEVDLLYEVPPEAVEFVRAGADVSTFSFLRPYAYLLGVNFRHPVLSRQDVRAALNSAIDRAAIVDRALGGRGQPAFDHVFPSHWAYDAHVPTPSFDARRAGRLLDAAGLLPIRPGGERRSTHRFRFTCLVPADYPLIERMALVVQKQLGDIGVDMNIEAVPLPELQQRLAQGRFDAYLFELLAGHGFNWSYWFWRSPVEGMSMVRSGYSAADAALDRLRLAHREDEQAAAVRGLQEIMRADPPGVFLCWGQVSRAVVRRFEVPAEENRDILSTIERWRLRRDEAPR